MMNLNNDVIDSIVGRAFSRALWIDVEAAGALTHDGIADSYNLVLRGEDKVKSGAKPSEADSAEDRKEHTPAMIWNGADAEPIGYSIASFDTLDDAELVAMHLLQFYADASEEIPYTERAGALCKDASALLPIVLSVYGVRLNGEMMRGGRIGSYADFKAGTWKKPRTRKTKTRTDADVLAEAKRIFEKMDDSTAAAMMGMDVDVYRRFKQAQAAFQLS